MVRRLDQSGVGLGLRVVVLSSDARTRPLSLEGGVGNAARRAAIADRRKDRDDEAGPGTRLTATDTRPAAEGRASIAVMM